MAKALDVANYFLSRHEQDSGDDEGISNLKLQKLTYYAQGFHLALTGDPLFSESIEAWAHGPVIPSLYHSFKVHGRDTIPAPKNFDATAIFTKDQMELLEEVYDVFGQYSAWRLRSITHQESPWIKHAPNASEIPHSELTEYFRSRLR